MFPWSAFLTGPDYWDDQPWIAFNKLMEFVIVILSWDVIKGTLAICATIAIIGYIIGRLKRVAGAQ